jgi:hypothetical protein
VDDIVVHTFARGQTLFLVWVSLSEHKWVTLAERRRPKVRNEDLKALQMIGASALEAVPEKVIALLGDPDRPSTAEKLRKDVVVCEFLVRRT